MVKCDSFYNSLIKTILHSTGSQKRIRAKERLESYKWPKSNMYMYIYRVCISYYHRHLSHVHVCYAFCRKIIGLLSQTKQNLLFINLIALTKYQVDFKQIKIKSSIHILYTSMNGNLFFLALIMFLLSCKIVTSFLLKCRLHREEHILLQRIMP